MDPNLFHVNWDQLFEVVAAVVVLSFAIERGLAIIFEHRFYIGKFDKKGLKEPIAFVVAYIVCWKWDFDLISVVLRSESSEVIGKLLTAAIIAGGSKASIKLFHDLLKVKSKALATKDASDGKSDTT